MRLPFDGDYPVTQEFGNVLILNGVDIYKQWGYRGHNGMDFGVPSLTKCVAPHKGQVKIANFDPNGYGWYVKIENDVEGSVIAHMDHLSVSPGFILNEGDEIGWSDSTGISTDPHVHWGYYLLPLNTSNGYGGYSNQRHLLESAGLIEPLVNATPNIITPVVDPKPTQTVSTIDWYELDGQKVDLNNKESFIECFKMWKRVMVDKEFITKSESEAAVTVAVEEVKDELELVREQGRKELDQLKKQIDELPKTPATTTETKEDPRIDRLTTENNRLVTQNLELEKKLKITTDDYEQYRKSINAAHVNSIPMIPKADYDSLDIKLKETDKDLKGTMIQLKQVLDRNKVLTDQLGEKETEDATAIEWAIKTYDELKKIKELKNIKTAIDTQDPDRLFGSLKDAFSWIFNLRLLFVKTAEKVDKETAKAGKTTRVKMVAEKLPDTSGSLLQILGIEK